MIMGFSKGNSFHTLWILVTVAELVYTAGLKIGKGKVCEGHRNYSESELCCKTRKGFSLPKDLDNDDQMRIVNEMRLTNLSTVWLYKHRKKLTGWTWTNGSQFKGTKPWSTDGKCGMLNNVTTKLQTAPCSQMNMGFICERIECESCFSVPAFQSNCLHLSGVCYIAFCGTDNWYTARETCQTYSLSFATPPNNEIISGLLSMKVFEKCPETWIGLRTTEWEPLTSSARWGPRQPSEDGDCVVVHRKSAHLSWEVRPCSSRHQHLCVTYGADGGLALNTQYSDSKEKLGYTTVRSTHSSSGGQTSKTAVYLVIPLVIIVLVILCAWKRKRIREQFTGSSCLKFLENGHPDESHNPNNRSQSVECQPLNPGGEQTIKLHCSETNHTKGVGEDLQHPTQKERQNDTAEGQDDNVHGRGSLGLVAWVFVRYDDLADKQLLRVKMFATADRNMTKESIQFSDDAAQLQHVHILEIYLQDSNSTLLSEIEDLEKASSGWEYRCLRKEVPVDIILQNSQESRWTTLVDGEISRSKTENEKDHIYLQFKLTEIFVNKPCKKPQEEGVTVIFSQIKEMVEEVEDEVQNSDKSTDLQWEETALYGSRHVRDFSIMLPRQLMDSAEDM